MDVIRPLKGSPFMLKLASVYVTSHMIYEARFGAPGNRTPLKKLGRNIMATYECSKCGMSVNATCGKCNDQLVNDTLKLEDGSEVQISKCPNDHGKIKSPLCCGQDMVCSS